VPLKLITGPANSGKAGRVLGELRARLDEEPILVVPAFRDVERSQRELSAAGAVFGARVVRFKWLFELVAGRAAAELLAMPRASEVRRTLIVEEAVRSSRLTVLRASAERPGFARAALAFVSELERARVEPERLGRALAQWAAGGTRARYCAEVSELYAAYRRGLDDAGLLDDDLFALRALEALSLEPFRWGRTPLLVHGFDDFTELELDAIETIATRAGADVTVSLPYERGRVAFRSLARVFERLRSVASAHEELAPSADHYDEASRAPLHHLERSLLAEQPRRIEPEGAVRLLSAGGQRAEAELVATEVLALLRQGVEPGKVAVVLRDPNRSAPLVEAVLDAYGVPFSIERDAPLRHTPLGRGLLALLRCALLDGTAADLVAYLRTPGRLARAAVADRLERDVRQAGAEGVEHALELWTQARRTPLVEIERLRAAGSGAALANELDRQLQRLFWRAYGEHPRLLEASERDDPRVLSVAHHALEDLRALARSHPGSVDARRVHDTLADLRVRLGEDDQPGRVLVTSPESLRARRFAAVFVCGLQEAEFPRTARPEPFLPHEDRLELGAATGLALPLRDDQLDRERFLFYLCASRAERLLVLSSRLSDEEGSPAPASFFLEDVRDVFTQALDEGTRRRSLADVTWPVAHAPTAVEWERSQAAASLRVPAVAPEGLADPDVLAALGARRAFSAGALEAYADCPVRWFVERELDPLRLEPEPEPMVRGRYAHEVLELTFRRLRERTGHRRVTSRNLAEAERLALEAIAERQSSFAISPQRMRVRAAVRRLEFDVLRLLRREAERDGSFAPEHLELRFGLGEDGHGPVPLGPPGVSLHGVIDRVDTSGDRALVVDYKSGSRVDPVATWERRNRLQAAIYMLAVDHLLDLRSVGGVYAPLRGKDLRPRGLLAAECREEIGSGYVGTDFRSPEDFDDQLILARERIAGLVGDLRSGRIECRPQSCSSRGGCSHPSICRVE